MLAALGRGLCAFLGVSHGCCIVFVGGLVGSDGSVGVRWFAGGSRIIRRRIGPHEAHFATLAQAGVFARRWAGRCGVSVRVGRLQSGG